MKVRRSTWIPLILLAYLGVMSYIGFHEYQEGHYIYYFGVIGVTLAVIALLYVFLRKRERQRERHQ